MLSGSNPEGDLKAALTRVPQVLPDGGILGFGLSHAYPFNSNSTNLFNLKDYLKGSDATINRVCDALSLESSLMAFYREQSKCVGILLPKFVDFGTHQVDDRLAWYLRDFRGSITVVDCDSEGEDDGFIRMMREGADVYSIVWANPLAEVNAFKSAYISYGNEATLDYAYGEVCLVIELPPAEERQ
ncbi:unnamed protein product [Cyclocybe aegerita]|uniref:Uncharacterized protein n=1 Tax=Cyclocybe aegerita TaxID=1973307 RepID=A0A8S0VZE1_CYCAE|nr:unnamed protein product [Cyclocybe aegerita]